MILQFVPSANTDSFYHKLLITWWAYPYGFVFYNFFMFTHFSSLAYDQIFLRDLINQPHVLCFWYSSKMI